MLLMNGWVDQNYAISNHTIVGASCQEASVEILASSDTSMLGISSGLAILVIAAMLPGAGLRDRKGGTCHTAGTLALPPLRRSHWKPSAQRLCFVRAPGGPRITMEEPALFHSWCKYGNCSWTVVTQALPFIHMKNQPCHRQSERIRQQGVMWQRARRPQMHALSHNRCTHAWADTQQSQKSGMGYSNPDG